MAGKESKAGNTAEGREKDLTPLEENLLRLSERYLKAKKLRYHDDIVETLVSLYCLKESETEKADRKSGSPSFFKRPLAAIGRIRSRGKLYEGIDREYYRASDFVTWARARPLLLELRQRIRAGEFEPDWGNNT